jgi:hypothetical protein
MKQLVDEYIEEFIMNEKKITFNDFIKYFYFSFDKKIKNEKKKLLKDKYIKMRKSILKYFSRNKVSISNRIKQKSINK